jgi:hypothetical protein
MIDSGLASSKPQNAFLSPVLTMLRHDHPIAVKPASMPWYLLPKQTCKDSLPIDTFHSAVFILVIALLSLEIPEGLTNYSVYVFLVMETSLPYIMVCNFLS